MTPCIWLGTTHPCNPPNYGLWVNLLFFICVSVNIVFRPCYLFLLWNVVPKCLALCLITIIAAYFLHLCACLACSSVHASSLHPLLVHHHLSFCVMLMSIAFFLLFYFFFIYAAFLCDSILDCLCTYFCFLLFFFFNSQPGLHRLWCLSSENSTVYCLRHSTMCGNFQCFSQKTHYVSCPVTSVRRQSRLYLWEWDRGGKERTPQKTKPAAVT